ncbi:sensor histidine kinase [Runella aurantiaca]|nr:histidine kinase [Runella aurantiaca]
MLRPRFFSPAEWRYHLLMMPLLFTIGNYFFIGMDYFRSLDTFIAGTVVILGLYWFSIVLLTIAIRKVLAFVPEQYILKRILIMMGVVGVLTGLLAIFDVWVYSVVPHLSIPFSWAKVKPIWILGAVFDVFICAALNLFYAESCRRKKAQATRPNSSPLNASSKIDDRLVITYQGWWSGVSPLEWGFHGLVLLMLVPLTNYLIIGPNYLSDPLLLSLGSALVVMLYIPCAVLLTLSVRLAIRTFPLLRQTLFRVLLMLFLTGTVSSTAVVCSLWVISEIDIFGVTFSIMTAKAFILLGLCFDFLLCLTHGYFYALSMWQQEQVEKETLKNEALQRRYDTLKGQVNPHFLFNSLTSLSSLIQEDVKQAEKFVDELAKVYRYLLQTHQNPLTTLEKEINFINSYVFLLKIRYGNGISVTIDVDNNDKSGYLPPLTLQMLLENAMKNNTISAKKPLSILIQSTEEGQLMIQHTIQKRMVSIADPQAELTNLVGKYTFLTVEPVSIFDNGTTFTVLLPLLPNLTVSEDK